MKFFENIDIRNIIYTHKRLILGLLIGLILALFIVAFFVYKFNNPTIKLVDGKVPNLIVSFTSYPPRIKTAHIAAESLLNQTLKPEKVILWLAPEEFPNKEKDLPKELIDLTKKYDNFEIGWYKNIKSYKKFIPTLIYYPDATIITADDDYIYGNKNVEILFKEHMKHPSDIIAPRTLYVNRIDNKFVFPFIPARKLNKLNLVSYNLLHSGKWGVLYPQNSLHTDVLREDLFLNLAEYHDDAWFWAMEVLNNTKIRKIYNKNLHFKVIIDKKSSLNEFRKKYNIGTDEIVLPKIIQHYPQIEKKLKNTKDELPKYLKKKKNIHFLFK